MTTDPLFAALSAPSMPAAALLDVARAFTPRFESIGPVVLLDASGLSRLFGTAQELGEHLRDAVARLAPGDSRVDGRVAIASTQTAAMLLALGTPGLTVVMPGKAAIALAPLGVGVLDQFEQLTEPSAVAPAAQERRRDAGPDHPAGGWHHPRSTHQASRGRGRVPDNRLLEILQKWGVRTLGALAALPGPEIHERLGDRGTAWQALARGIDRRPLVPWVDEVPFEAALELEWPIEGLEPLSFVLARLLEPLADRLERADRGAAVIYTTLRLTSRTVHTRTLQLPAPMRDPKTLRTLVLLDLESHPPDAPIDVVRVLIDPTPARVLQWTLLERAQPAVEQVSTLVARLTALMGAGRVGSPGLVDTWMPGSFAMGDFRLAIGDCLAIGDRRSSIQSTIADRQLSIESSIDNPQSPNNRQSAIANLQCALRRFRFPIPARVVVQEGRPVRVQVDRQGLASGAITQAAGPWRTSGQWWDAEAWDRDEWDVSMADGTVFRLVVERGVGQWFVDGVID